MATSLPHVRVGPIEAGQGFSARCGGCPWSIVRGSRHEADQAAVTHRASHATPDPADQVGLLEEA